MVVLDDQLDDQSDMWSEHGKLAALSPEHVMRSGCLAGCLAGAQCCLVARSATDVILATFDVMLLGGALSFGRDWPRH